MGYNQKYYSYADKKEKPASPEDEYIRSLKSFDEQARNKNNKYYIDDSWEIIENKNYKPSETDIIVQEMWQELKSKIEFDSEEKETKDEKTSKENVKIHYNSKEPEKFGAKAFTKNAEIFIAPGQEDLLEHELGHVIQQMEGKVKPTGEINGEKVNTDPKLEQEADEMAENVYTMKNIKVKPVQTPDVIQFGQGQSKKTSGNCGKQLFDELEKSKPHGTGPEADAERERLTEIICILRDKKLFPKASLISASKDAPFDLKSILTWLEPEQSETVKSCILKLKNYCDSEGLKSVLEGANVNSRKDRLLLVAPSKGDDELQKTTKASLAEAFVKRIKLMTEFVERVYRECDEQYWIRSTGSDPHHAGQHALFLIPKKPDQVPKTDVAALSNEEQRELKKYPPGTCVYKPHELDADAAVVGQRDDTFSGGMFDHVNEKIKDAFVAAVPRAAKSAGLELTLDDPKALATMMINHAKHREHFVRKKKSMTPAEAHLYFFRAGILKVITDAMAVIDLHQDNVMPVGNSPLIIDAEVAFFQEQDSGLTSSALTTDHYDRDETRPRTNSSFDITGVGKSAEVFNDTTKPTYRMMFNQGYAFMLDQMRSDTSFFADLYETQLKNISKVRILPVATPDFAQFLQGGIMDSKAKTSSYVEARNRVGTPNRQYSASWVADEIEIRLKDQSRRFIFDDVELDKNELTKAIKTTFDNGTIIAVYVDMNDGQIYLDNTPIGKILRANHPLTKADIIKIMKERFLNTIKTSANTPV